MLSAELRQRLTECAFWEITKNQFRRNKMARLNECILYRDFEHGDLLDKMAEIMT